VGAVLLFTLFLFNITSLFCSVSLISCYSGEVGVSCVQIRTTAAICLMGMLFLQVTEVQGRGAGQLLSACCPWTAVSEV